MKLGNIVKISFFVSLILVIVGAYLKIVHSENAQTFLISGIMVSAIFIATSIYEVRTSQGIQSSEKTMWTLGLLFFSGLVGILYVLFARRRIA